MGYYRYEMNDEEDDSSNQVNVEKLEISHFDELPEKEYEELIARSIAINNRLQIRQRKLHEIMVEEVGKFSDEGTIEETYWRTAMMEQLAFFELQISNIHKFLEQIINKTK